MQRRLDFAEAAPGAMRAMYTFQKYVEESGGWRELSKRVRSASSAMTLTATVNCTPRRACMASTTR